MTQPAASIVVVNDASCLIDLRRARLLHLVVRLPYRLIIPLPVRESELVDFTPQEWAILDGGMETFDLPPDRVVEAFAVKATYPKLSANDCFCLVTTRCHEDAILLTGDGLLRRVATDDGRRVHGVLWVLDELQRLTLLRRRCAHRCTRALAERPGSIPSRIRNRAATTIAQTHIERS